MGKGILWAVILLVVVGFVFGMGYAAGVTAQGKHIVDDQQVQTSAPASTKDGE